MSKFLSAFSAFGIEIEYMIVDRTTLDVAPLADRLLTEAPANSPKKPSRARSRGATSSRCT